MSTQLLTIKQKLRQNPIALAKLEDFETGDARAVDARVVLERPNISLYCLDPPSRRAVFVETAPEAALSGAPFYYQAQYQEAERLITVPYETLHELAAGLWPPPDPGRIVLIYSVGRCGSTLLSRAFAEADGAFSFSEPDVFTHILALREPDGSNAAEIRDLVRSCTRIMCAAAANAGFPHAWALKFRSFGIHLGDVFHELFPEASVIFLYRHMDAWARSAARAFRVFEPEMIESLPTLQKVFSRLDPLIAEYTATHTGPISPVELLTCMWVSVMERSLELRRLGVQMFAVSYEELTAAPVEVLRAVFEHCGAAAADTAIESVLKQDSQAGTSLSQAGAKESRSELLPEHLEEMHRLLRGYSAVLSPDFMVPRT